MRVPCSLDDGVFLRKEVLALGGLDESLLIRLDYISVRRRVGKSIEALDIVEPEFHDPICIAQIRTARPIARYPTLDVTAHIALYIGLTREKGSMYVSPVRHVLLMGHVRSTSAKNMYLQHLNYPLCARDLRIDCRRV